jgi:hypothetical protein
MTRVDGMGHSMAHEGSDGECLGVLGKCVRNGVYIRRSFLYEHRISRLAEARNGGGM